MDRAKYLLLLALAACATAPAPIGSCIKVKSFSQGDQVAMAQALIALPPTSPLVPMALDWERMREESRACQAQLD